ncbi:unnamed protein product [Oppiella nova]|uniref:FHA domain-containing protein n=1 Tax=Oppiella nova TaxID=334625 RepID=A0A7R9M0Y7_9ACAR|nr:unnamed protein product [Oppiella nova]CAG2168827.1 unnamed protein product [Oppiella nova]
MLYLKTLSLKLLIIIVNLSEIKCQYYGQDAIGIHRQLCDIPQTLQGEWFSREFGENVFTTITSDSVSNRGQCLQMQSTNYDNFTLVLRQGDCYHCVRLIIRTLNVLEKIETTNPSGKNCRSSLEGVWKFGYQNRYKFTGECTHPEANITACQIPGTQFFNVNQQFIMNYRKCTGMQDTEDAEVQFKCLGDWYVGKNHYFAVVNSRESRIEEKYRCFLANRDDDVFLSVSITAECNTLRSPQEGPERLRLFPVKTEVVPAKCTLPQNFTGIWVNTANFDAEVSINATYMVEKWRPDTGRVKQEIYVCQERRGTRFVMARLGINGCQKDFVCYDFVSRHHNIIRYRKGQPMIIDTFATVCAWNMFDDAEEWKYDLLIAKNPISTKCPIAGKFRFDQSGDIPFETRIRGGVTQIPRPNVYCKENISDFSVCDADKKIIEIDANYCISVDHFGRPVDIYSEPDYQMQCIGFWKENLKSYLVTYDPLDAYSKYRCWVYQRADLNVILMSLSVGAFCHIRQDVRSGRSGEGAQIALLMAEYEREHDDCPMYFDDGSNPYIEVLDQVTVLKAISSAHRITQSTTFSFIIKCCYGYLG